MESPQPNNPVANPQSTEWTVQKILTWTTEHLRNKGIESPRLESEILLAHARKCERIQLYTNFAEILSEEVRAKMRELVKRRVNREPVAYLVGKKEFFSLDFLVKPGVFIPRPETEALVMKSLEALANRKSPHILELCSGSGCISISLAKQLPEAQVTAVELHGIPYQATLANAQRHKVNQRVQVLQGNLFEPLPSGVHYDLLVSNPPYVREDEMAGLEADVQHHEPREALVAGEDGLDIVRKILDQAGTYLKPGAHCLLEMDPAQTQAAMEYAIKVGTWSEVQGFVDDTGRTRFLSARHQP